MSTHTVTFVGAGPGAADLITLRGLKALQSAQAVLFDALIDASLLTHCSSDAILIDVGKRCGLGRSRPQDEINQLLVENGLAFERVVRLKGGDPSIFGRLDEEMSAVKAAGLNVEVVPGVTAALAAAAAAQTPLTRRGVSRSVRLMTASVGQNQPHHAWDAHADANETMVFYMAGRQLQQIAHSLLDKGFSPNTPALIMQGVSWSNQSEQRTVLGQLADFGFELHDAPCVLLVGLALADK
ncbi:uroporphyrinogen-III C-methyltransferase [Hydromonas duriensis]|uniref:uroporphyrinogen-III C-methyltransferase n=1 Tax=Hydromonas duriensis TaxID=1527608 RepID=A0A4R6Y5V0_9BURK|nr:uroporphyrinogen-III C-methyltransferase [Hydromonas duriensis]TDR30732.1 uroporphyrinogen-III C-methyltransferase [Hydromonas duriensis]